jgi:death-on-curing protein
LQTPEFVPKVDVLAIHKRQIERFGGLDGIRDEGLLDSALAQPQTTFFGELLHPTIPTQAAAYLYHLAKNHPFLDGNKRTAFATTVAFLGMNGYKLSMTEEEAYNMVMQVAQGEMSKEELSSFLEKHIRVE